MRQSLPGEIWRLIFTDITHNPSAAEESRRVERGRPWLITLCNLCLVSKTFRNAAEPVLYNTFTPRYGHSLVRWAYTILQNPRLAEHVREVELRPFDYVGIYIYRFHETRATANIAYYSFFLQLAQDLGIIDRDAELLYGDLKDTDAEFHGRMWLLLHLLCVKLPNLEKMMVYTISPPEFSHFWTKTELAPPNLRELRVEWSDELEMASNDDEGVGMGMDVAGLGGLLALPKLERLHLYRFIGSVRRDQLDRSRQSVVKRDILVNENLTWLRCANCLVDQQTLQNVVAIFPNLEIFEYHVGSISNYDGAPVESYGSEVMQALTPLSAKLKSLTLDLIGQDNRKTLLKSQKYYIPSLAAFERLEDLSVDMMLVVKRKVEQAATHFANSPETVHVQERDGKADNAFCEYFPPNLKRLRITRVDEKLINPLTGLSSNVETWMCKLEEVELQLEPGVINTAGAVRRLNGRYLRGTSTTVSNRFTLARSLQKSGVKRNADGYEANIDNISLPPQWRNIVDMFTSRGIGVKMRYFTGSLTPEAV